MPAIESHPTIADLEAYGLGTLDDDAQAEVEGHLERCPECQHAAAESPVDPFVKLLRTARPGDTPSLARNDTLLEPVVPAELLDHPRYRVERLLGAGGMGAVWLAEHKVMGRRVALKVIRPEFLARPGAVERFRREAHAAARLQHPNIVAAYDAEQAGNTHFLVMEYVEGRTLAELLADGPLPPTQACGIAVAVARGVEHAHSQGIIHRDLKPGNILIGPSREPKVADFGLATITADESGLTAANMVVGTPDYIAPEQAEDPRAADARSDVYALGCTLYEMLTGRVPFPGESVLRKLDAHRARKPESLPPGVSSGLAAVVAKMMAKRPLDRYQSAAECAAALEAIAASGESWVAGAESSKPRSGRSPGLRRLSPGHPLLLPLALAIFGALIAGVELRVQTGEGEVVVNVESPDVQIVLLQGGNEIQIIDTKTQKRVTVPIGNYDVKLKDQPDGLTVRTDKITVRRGKEALVTIERVAGPAPKGVDFANPVGGREIRSIAVPWRGRELGNILSPDGKYVLVPSAEGAGEADYLRIENVVTGTNIGVFRGKPLTWANFTGDGKRLVVAVRADKGYDVYMSDIPSGTSSRIHHFAGHDLRPVLLQLSDDTKLLAWSLQDNKMTTSSGVDALQGDRKRTFIVPPQTSKSQVTIQTRLSPNGRVAATAQSWDSGESDGRTGVVRMTGLDPEKHVGYQVGGHVFDPFVADDGRVGAVCYRRGEGYSIEWWPNEHSSFRQRVGARDSKAVYSDGRGARVAVWMSDDTIRVEDVGGWTTARFVAGPFRDLKGCWLSADGSTMAVQTDTHLRLYRLPSIFK